MNRLPRSRSRFSVPTLSAALLAAAAAPCWSEPAVVPAPAAASGAQAQFGGQCAEALAEGRHVMTDCAVRWRDQDGKDYCFKDAAAKALFLKDPAQNLRRARDFIAASRVASTEQQMQYFDGKDAETLVTRVIQDGLRANGGAFPVVDPENGDHLQLAFDGIDFTRTLDGYGFFPDVKFHDRAHPEKRYLIDFWVAPVRGQLALREIRIYKTPLFEDGRWKMMERQPIPWWWIPASEHPGKLAVKRGWEVMSAVERHALQTSELHGGVFELKDDKTGKVLRLKFVDTHQPIRQLDGNGHYFACTDFRVVGTKHQIYDIDFWVDDKNGRMTVDQTRVHKVPEYKDGRWIQVPRYEWKDLGSSHLGP